jgi:hypothetical protein
MIYIASFNDTPATDSVFASRGEPKLKQGPVSSTHITVFPTIRQLAYDGYNKNIDVFLAATANKRVYNVAEQFYKAGPVEVTFPLSLPSANLSFKVTDKALLKRVLDRIDERSPKEQILGVGGHPQAYTVDKPTFKMEESIRSLLKDEAPRVTGKTTFSALRYIRKAYECIELYLRVNTYPAFRDKDSTVIDPGLATYTMSKRVAIDDIKGFEVSKRAYTSVSLTHDAGSKGKKIKEEGYWIGEEIDKDMRYDVVIDGSPVLHAKPSPAEDSTKSFSTPSQAPNLPGILFPYFPGMNTPDASTIRTLMNRFFFRCFGNKEEYTKWRQSVSAWASTREGIILAHILKGIEISLDAQGQLHLLFDGNDYLGFVVYGECWTIQFGNRWFVPMSAEDLSAELSTIRTHAGSLEDLVKLLLEHGVILDEADVRPVTVAEALSKVEWPEDEDQAKEDMKRFNDIVGRLDFQTRPIGPGANTFLEALETIVKPGSLGKQHIHFLLAQEYHLYSTRAGLVLSRFGSRVPSTIIYKTDETTKIVDNFSSKAKSTVREAALGDVKSVLVALKPLSNALRDYEILKETKTLCITSKERAAGYRHMQFGKKEKDLFLTGLADLKELWPVSVVDEPLAGPSGKKRKADEVPLDEPYNLDF